MQTTAAIKPDHANFDLFNLPDSYYLDPTPFYKELRDHDPMHWNSDGSVLLSRYEDIKAIWRDPTGKVNRAEAYAKKFGPGPLLEHHTQSMLFRDPPDHDRLRSVVNAFFTPKSIARMREGTQEIVAGLLDEIAEKGEIEFVSEFSSRIPIQVICDMFGVPRSDGPLIRDLGASILLPLNPAVSQDVIDQGHDGAEKFKAYLLEQFKERRKLPVEDDPSNIINALVKAEKEGQEISEDEMAHICILLLNGGHETTTNLIGLSTLALIRHPDQIPLMAHDPKALVPGVDECVRYVTPLQLQGRRTSREVEIPSGRIPANTEVIISQASANRDERVFDQPNQLNLLRRPNAHLAFGVGIHACLGSHLARLEVSETLPRLFQRFPKMQLTSEPEFNRNARFRGLKSMRVKLS